jgi:3-hydroxy-9,10-secoandrosta-1,3,5(10)-triene-9,17-dione monooxygenase
MISSFSAEARAEALGVAGSYQLISASIEPVGRAKPVEGGVIYSGQHKFASGIDHASWLIGGGFIDRDGVRDGPFLFLMPKSDVVIKDDWNTLGLEGTGSKSFEVNELFIPQHRFVRMLGTGGDLEVATAWLAITAARRGYVRGFCGAGRGHGQGCT